MSSKLIKTSVQLPQSTLDWLSTWKGLTQSQAIRLILERAQEIEKATEHVRDIVDRNFDKLYSTLRFFDLTNYDNARDLTSIVDESIKYEVVSLSLVERIRLLDLTRQRMLTNSDK